MERVIPRADLLVEQCLSGRGSLITQARYAVDSVNGKAEPISTVADSQLQRSVNVALLTVSDNVQVMLTLALVRQAMDQPRVTVEVEDNGLVICEDGLKLGVSAAVRMLARADEFEEVDDVDKANLDPRNVLAEEGGGRK